MVEIKLMEEKMMEKKEKEIKPIFKEILKMALPVAITLGIYYLAMMILKIPIYYF